jgi:hypothetical protein
LNTLQAPNLDDRDFQQLVEEAKRVIATRCPQWTDLSTGDPGIVILELFAFLTETMIYRLNRLPEKAYVEFLRLIGVKLRPPVAANVRLTFKLSKAQDKPLEIPRGTRVTLSRTSGGEAPPIFVVLQATAIPAGKTEVDAIAYHCDLIEGEDAGVSTGQPGYFITARRAPIVAPTSDDLELTVGVEADPSELTGRIRALEYDGRPYIIWRENEGFTNLMGRRRAYTVDRLTGTITFASAVQLVQPDGQLEKTPTMLADVPQAGRRIRLWYCAGGGLAGNVAADTLTMLKDTIPGVSVTNPEPATGGGEAETLDNALLRGPQELHSLQRAVTSTDFELIALKSSGAVARAKAFTRARVWRHAQPGTVEVLLVPAISEDQRPLGVVTEETLHAHENNEALVNIQEALDERRSLGTMCLADWVNYKRVSVEARTVIHRGEDPTAVKARVLARLHQTINPLPSRLSSTGWPFGSPVRVSQVYDIMLAEAGVSYVDNVRLLVDEVPDAEVSCLARDSFQPHTWYATTQARLFRSMNDGEGWELMERFAENESTVRVCANPFQAGQVALITNLSTGSRIYLSDDCGESWRRIAETAFTTSDVAWVIRQRVPLLMLATDKGLFELSLQADASPVQIPVDASRPTMGFWAIACAVGIKGEVFVAAATRGANGVFLSTKGGQAKSFDLIKTAGDDIRVLEMQQDDVRTFLWGGVTVAGNEPGKGCFRWELLGDTPPGAATNMIKGWVGGSCHGLAFTEKLAFAATHDKGVLWLDLDKGSQASWNAPLVESGLKLRDDNRTFQPVHAIAASPPDNLAMAGGPAGIFASNDGGTNYRFCSARVFMEKVTLPETWLFCSGEHKVEVVSEDEA